MLDSSDLNHSKPMAPTPLHRDTLAERIAILTSENAELQLLFLELAAACTRCCHTGTALNYMPDSPDLNDPSPMALAPRHGDTLAERVVILASENATLQLLLVELAAACEQCCLERCQKPTDGSKPGPCWSTATLARAGFVRPPAPPEHGKDTTTR